MDPSMASRETFTLKTQTHSFKNHNPTQNTTATLQILLRHKYQFHVQTYNEAVLVGLPLTFVHEMAISPAVICSHCFAMPPHVIAMAPLRRRSILKVLASLSIDGSLCECLVPSIEKYVVREAERFGYKGFGVVADLEVVTKVYGYDHETVAAPSPNLLRQRRIAAKVADVYGRDEKACGMMPLSDPKKLV